VYKICMHVGCAWQSGRNVHRVQGVLSVSEQSGRLCTGNEDLHVRQSTNLREYDSHTATLSLSLSLSLSLCLSVSLQLYFSLQLY